MRKIDRRSAQSAEPPVSKLGARVIRSIPRKKKIYACCTLAVAVLLVAFALGMRALNRTDQYLELYSLASEYAQSGQYDAALTALRRAEKYEATDEVILLTADCYEAQGNYELALETLRRLNVNLPEVAERVDRVSNSILAREADGTVQLLGQEYAPGLRTLNLSNSGITDEQLLQVCSLYSLEELDLSGNGLRDISGLSTLGGLSVLNLSGNCLTDLTPLSSLEALRRLVLDGNPVESFEPLYGLTNLTELSICDVRVDEETLRQLSEALPNCAVYSNPETGEAAELTLGGVSFRADVKELSLAGLGISDISILSRCTALTKLDLSGNAIEDISALAQLPGLTWLDISDNAVTGLGPLLSLTGLTKLDASGNQISAVVALSSLTQLGELDLSNNPLTSLSGLGRLNALKELHLNSCDLTDELLPELEGLTGLRYLELKDNDRLSGEAVDQLKSCLKESYVEHSKLAYQVEFAGQSYPDNVVSLRASGLGLSDIGPVSRFTRVEDMDLSSNEISVLSPISWCTELRSLNLANNSISDVSALAGLAQLEVLDLSGNRVASVQPLLSLRNLRELNVSGNGMTEAMLETLRNALPDCNILY